MADRVALLESGHHKEVIQWAAKNPTVELKSKPKEEKAVNITV